MDKQITRIDEYRGSGHSLGKVPCIQFTTLRGVLSMGNRKKLSRNDAEGIVYIIMAVIRTALRAVIVAMVGISLVRLIGMMFGGI